MTPDFFAKEKTTLVFDQLFQKRMQVLDLEPNLDLFHLGRTFLSQPPNQDLGLGE